MLNLCNNMLKWAWRKNIPRMCNGIKSPSSTFPGCLFHAIENVINSIIHLVDHDNIIQPHIMSATETLTWTKPSVSEETGQWADLVTLDLAEFDQPGGKQRLAAEFTRAIEEVGKSDPSIGYIPSRTC